MVGTSDVRVVGRLGRSVSSAQMIIGVLTTVMGKNGASRRLVPFGILTNSLISPDPAVDRCLISGDESGIAV